MMLLPMTPRTTRPSATSARCGCCTSVRVRPSSAIAESAHGFETGPCACSSPAASLASVQLPQHDYGAQPVVPVRWGRPLASALSDWRARMTRPRSAVAHWSVPPCGGYPSHPRAILPNRLWLPTRPSRVTCRDGGFSCRPGHHSDSQVRPEMEARLHRGRPRRATGTGRWRVTATRLLDRVDGFDGRPRGRIHVLGLGSCNREEYKRRLMNRPMSANDGPRGTSHSRGQLADRLEERAGDGMRWV